MKRWKVTEELGRKNQKRFLCGTERKKQADIAKALGRNQSSLLRELAKGLEKRAYNPFLAQRETDKRAAYRKLALKIDAQTWEAINNHLSLRWSPKQIENFLHTGGNDLTVISVSEKTIKSYINLHMKGELGKLAEEELRQKGNLREKGPESTAWSSRGTKSRPRRKPTSKPLVL